MMTMKKVVLLLFVFTLALSLTGISSAATTPSSKTGVYYEIFVRSFNDSNGDGIGDLNGVTQKLDYLKELGVKGIWLMPILASPSYHGYDTTDYYKINPEYGTTADLKALVAAAHKKGIKVIMDLVLNHASSQHPWFVDASTNPNSKYRDYFVFAGPDDDLTAQSAAGAGDAWHAAATGHYLGIFWSGMPDWNYNNPAVRSEMVKVGQYWLDPKVAGVDGYRLDAAKHIFDDFTDQNMTKANARGVAWWQEFRAGINKVNKKAYLVGEIWDSASVIGPYLNNALNSAFNFDTAKNLVDSVKGGTDGGIGFILSRVSDYYARQSNGSFIDAPMLTNHDQTRVMSELEGNVNKAKVAASML
jgi:glycosidase